MARLARLVLGALLLLGCATAQAQKTPLQAAPALQLWSHTFVASRAGTVTAVGFARKPPGVALVRYLPSGRLDVSFRRRVHPEFGAGKLDALAAATDAAGRTLVAACQPPDCWGYSVLGRFRPTGELDPSFGDHGIVRTAVADGALEPRAIELLRDGRIVVAGEVSKGSLRYAFVARYTRNGVLDRTFSRDGVMVDQRFLGAQAVAAQRDGRLLVAGPAYVARYRPDGTRDAGFSSDGLSAAPGFLGVGDMLADGEDRVVVAGSALPRERPVFVVARLTANGTLDQRFGRRGVVVDRRARDHWARVEQLLTLPDGRLFAVGWATRGGGSPLTRRYRAVVLRLTAAGQLDPSFGTNGRVTIGAAEAQARPAFVRGRELLVVGPDDDLKPTRIVFARVPYR